MIIGRGERLSQMKLFIAPHKMDNILDEIVSSELNINPIY